MATTEARVLDDLPQKFTSVRCEQRPMAAVNSRVCCWEKELICSTMFSVHSQPHLLSPLQYQRHHHTTAHAHTWLKVNTPQASSSSCNGGGNCWAISTALQRWKVLRESARADSDGFIISRNFRSHYCLCVTGVTIQQFPCGVLQLCVGDKVYCLTQGKGRIRSFDSITPTRSITRGPSAAVVFFQDTYTSARSKHSSCATCSSRWRMKQTLTLIAHTSAERFTNESSQA